jgi:protein KTI12
LTRDTIVVADGLNYIKGFRYQLYCEAKAVPTTYCVVHVGAPAERCREWNERALAAAAASNGNGNGNGNGNDDTTTNTTPTTTPIGTGYPPAIFENLLFRYEEPNGMNRWDAPLFTIPCEDPEPPYAAIWEALIGADGHAVKAVRPNAATLLKPAAEEGYLYALDKITSDVIAMVTRWEGDHAGEGGGEVVVGSGGDGGGGGGGGNGHDDDDDGEDSKLILHLPTTSLSVAQLQRLRRQFIGLNRQHSLSKARIRHLFVDYLNDSFQS